MNFRELFLPYLDELAQHLATPSGEWTVKGVIDVYQNIYTLSHDTKVISKVMEILLLPVLGRFSAETACQVILSEHQNHYPDVTFVFPDGQKIALDFKSTYRLDAASVSGFTLGAFTGYFRQRSRSKNITFPYQSYQAHYILGVIYTRNAATAEGVFGIQELSSIRSIIKDFAFLLHEKWRIASDRPGSGNTKNIGSVKEIEALLAGQGTFAAYDIAVFDDYWMNYLTPDMARAIDSEIPYRNLAEYWQWRGHK